MGRRGMRVRVGVVGLLVVSSLAPAWPSAAAARTAVVSDSTATVTYQVAAPPAPPALDTASDSGYRARRTRTKEVSSDHGRSEATTTQTTTTRHGPESGAYTVRRIRSVGSLAGEAQLTDVTGGPITSEATAESVTNFTVNRKVGFALDTTRTREADPDGCAMAGVTLSQGGQIIFRKYRATAGCEAVPEDVGTGSGELAPGDYTLETHAEGLARALNKYNVEYTAKMAAAVDATLQLGVGKVCTNILPRTAKTIGGTAGNDVLCGGPGGDTIRGRGGNDLIFGAGGGDTITGGAGDDRITPQGGADSASGNSGRDAVRGCDDTKDTLRGGDGTDKVFRDAIDDIGGFEDKTRC